MEFLMFTQLKQFQLDAEQPASLFFILTLLWVLILRLTSVFLNFHSGFSLGATYGMSYVYAAEVVPVGGRSINVLIFETFFTIGTFSDAQSSEREYLLKDLKLRLTTIRVH